MKYYILSTTGFIRNKKGTLHCEQYTHITRSLNSFLYFLAKTIFGAPKKVEEQSRGT